MSRQCEKMTFFMAVRIETMKPSRCAALPLTCSNVKGFFFWGMIEEQTAQLSSTSI